jgi:hypothetical protein
VFDQGDEDADEGLDSEADSLEAKSHLEWVRERYQAQVDRHARRVERDLGQIDTSFDAGGTGWHEGETADHTVDVEQGWSELQAKLVTHFSVASAEKLVGWLF